jgi:predicted signal transduction protein with EAL and GGDEF domain
VARLGGDEFLLICPDVAVVAAAENLAENVLEALHPPFLLDSHEFYVHASIGLALYPEDGHTAEQLLKNADVALYRAKDEGRNRFRFYTPAMDAFAQQRLVLEGRLRHAIKRDELHLVYQPIVDLADGRTVGVEALLRWENETLGAVSPAEFIPLAEDTGIIHELTRWVLERAARHTEAWNRRYPLRLAINISPKEFAGADRLVELVDEVLSASGLPPDRLELEVTEGLLMNDYPATSGALKYLDERHIRLSVDDFGTGYSALSYLQRFPFDTLKIDRSFVQGIEHDPASAALVRAILAMAKALGLDTVAEGVESKEQARFLAGYGCRYAQGYLFSPPLSAEQVMLHLKAERVPAA